MKDIKIVPMLLAILLLVCARSFSGDGTPTTTQPRAEHTASAAGIWCEGWVKESLRAPSTAKFPRQNRHQQHVGDGVYVVQGQVDAQNGFGAQIRNTFTCRAEYIGQDRWRLVSMSVR